ncbi:uncharacterized protein GLRG_08716 [Colletotrichum graminicola M1.001]|uniref:Uncharacterized protein n=1 Tax=Colletotrichum graminicola (strain M1.001 / M2 / FGSC 10212) TaxID=645133 RepID=E3QRE9_COLGM|nr:uncharacterized protein GLRG_08716 [Colletotrichum graminicola M1.001]EFQ33437.1 hypothetical protein GLRG_08716 [Colletotrichum graminicola M1.001]
MAAQSNGGVATITLASVMVSVKEAVPTRSMWNDGGGGRESAHSCIPSQMRPSPLGTEGGRRATGEWSTRGAAPDGWQTQLKLRGAPLSTGEVFWWRCWFGYPPEHACCLHFGVGDNGMKPGGATHQNLSASIA